MVIRRPLICFFNRPCYLHFQCLHQRIQPVSELCNHKLQMERLNIERWSVPGGFYLNVSQINILRL